MRCSGTSVILLNNPRLSTFGTIAGLVTSVGMFLYDFLPSPKVEVLLKDGDATAVVASEVVFDDGFGERTFSSRLSPTFEFGAKTVSSCMNPTLVISSISLSLVRRVFTTGNLVMKSPKKTLVSGIYYGEPGNEIAEENSRI